MSDWDFLYDMHDQGFSPEDIREAAAVGRVPAHGVSPQPGES